MRDAQAGILIPAHRLYGFRPFRATPTRAVALMRDTAADLYRMDTGSAWQPRDGSLVNRKALTSTVTAATHRRPSSAETEIMLPAGRRSP